MKVLDLASQAMQLSSKYRSIFGVLFCFCRRVALTLSSGNASVLGDGNGLCGEKWSKSK